MTNPASALAMTVWCGFCGTGPGTACAQESQHFDRYLQAYREGLIGRKAIRDACAGLGPLSAGTLAPDTPPLPVAAGPVARHSR
jgi:hypothetical protein